MKRITILILCILFSLPFAAAASGSDLFTLSPDLVLFGVTLHAGYNGVQFADNLGTTLWVIAGGGYETVKYYRLPNGSMYRGGVSGVDYDVDPKYSRLSFDWGAGITQGLLAGTGPGKGDLVAAFLFYRARYDQHFQDDVADQLLFRTTLDDRDGLLENSFLAGLQYDTESFDKVHKIRSGVYGEVSAEWAPGWFLNSVVGQADYLRFNGTVKGFLPLYVAESSGKGNLFGLYAGAFLSADYATGDAVPMHVRQSFGGQDPRTGLGGAVRGIDSGAFDALFKVVGNLEVRATLPSIVLPDLVPGFVAYFDTGYYDDLDGPERPSGMVNTAGFGLYLDLLDYVDIVFYTHYFINGTNASGDGWTPFDVSLGFRF